MDLAKIDTRLSHDECLEIQKQIDAQCLVTVQKEQRAKPDKQILKEIRQVIRDMQYTRSGGQEVHKSGPVSRLISKGGARMYGDDAAEIIEFVLGMRPGLMDGCDEDKGRPIPYPLTHIPLARIPG